MVINVTCNYLVYSYLQSNLVCGDSLKTSHIQMFFYFGLLVGDFVFGMFADA